MPKQYEWTVTDGKTVLGRFRLKSEAQRFLWQTKVQVKGSECRIGSMMKHLNTINPGWRFLPPAQLKALMAECTDDVYASSRGYHVEKVQ